MSKKVLIVDDEIILASNLQTYLEILGCVVRTAHDGASALELALSFQPDLLLLDYRLPDMDGFEVFETFRLLHRCDAVLMTAHPSVGVCNRAIQCNIEIILLKPFPLHELGNVVLHGNYRRAAEGAAPAQADRRRRDDANFPLRLYDGTWVLADRRQPKQSTPGVEAPVLQGKKGA